MYKLLSFVHFPRATYCMMNCQPVLGTCLVYHESQLAIARSLSLRFLSWARALSFVMGVFEEE